MDHPKWKVQAVWRMHNSDTFMKSFITRDELAFTATKLLAKAVSWITLLETTAARERPAGRSAEKSIPSALLALEVTGQL
jgi:hypothetical protein